MRLHAGLGLIFLAGCAGMSLTEADNGKRVEVGAGSTFTLSLPSSPSTQAEPKLSGGVIQLVSRKRDEAAKREILEFRALAQGETEIRFADYSVKVAVVSGGGENPVHMHNR